MKVRTRIALLGIGIASVLSLSLQSAAGEIAHLRVVPGVAVTGANNLLGQPLWDIGDLGLASFAFIFAHNPSGPEPLALTPDAPDDTLLATGLDSNFLAALGMTAADIDPEFVNVPLHAVQVITNPFLGTREQVPSVLDAPVFATSKSLPNSPITLGDWLEAEGSMRIRCHKDGTANVELRLDNLIANGVYTVWGLVAIDADGNGIEEQLVPTAFGGVPNVLIPDRQGRARFKRTLGYCPMQEPGLKFVDVTYHSDGNVYGGTVDLLIPGFPGFAVTNTHVAFPVNVESEL